MTLTFAENASLGVAVYALADFRLGFLNVDELRTV
jgi:hypothetical protein